PLCEIDASVAARFTATVATLKNAGATVDEAARPLFDDAEHQRLFMLLLRAATASRMRDEDFAAQQAIAASLSPDDTSSRATAAPLGLTSAGLPVGVQIVGGEGEDPTTIEFARLLAAEIGGFLPPPAFA